MNNPQQLDPNSLSFIALTNEFCQALEHAESASRGEFIAEMLKILPRIYIVASDVQQESPFSEYGIEPYLTEDVYNQVRDSISRLMAEEDVYLEVFVEDMKYSDSPIASSISENLADLYQEFFNFIASVKDATTEAQLELIAVCKYEFREFWGQTLCNVLRALHAAFLSPTE
ncbi:MAG: DUF5063 domain-containing protein [Sodaliphilus sp.]